MFTKSLLPDTFRAIKLISGSEAIKNAYLAGGTSLALQIGHRISVDLDFFSQETINELVVSQNLKKVSGCDEEGTDRGTVWGKIGKTKFSLFEYKYPMIDRFENFSNLKLASLKDISAMKIHVVSSRGTKRDFVDLYFLTKIYSVDEMLEFYNQKFKDLDERLYHIARSFAYFVDAEIDPTPNMIQTVEWQNVKKFFHSESMRLFKSF